MAPFPPPPVNTIDWSNVGFKVREVNGHIESTYSKATGTWTPLAFVRDPFMRIHGMAPALNYGQQAYEGLKAFRGPSPDSGATPGALSVFRPDRNATRLQHSADVVSMPRVPEAVFIDACRAAVSLNAGFVPPHETGAAMYVRPQLYGSSAQLGLSPPDEYTFAVFVIPTGVYHGVNPVKALVLEEFDRAAPNGVGHAKVGGNYAPVLRWSDAAREQGFGITLHLDSARHEEIDEFSTSGFIGVLKEGDGDDAKVTLVVPDSKCVIDSITSDSVQEIARSFGWGVEKRPIKYSELADFSEVFAAGTAAALVPIRSVTRRIDPSSPQSLFTTRAGHPRVSSPFPDSSSAPQETVTYLPDDVQDAGPVALKLLTTLQGIQLGKLEDKFGWRFGVSEEDGKKVVGGTEAMAAGNGANGVQAVGQMD